MEVMKMSDEIRIPKALKSVDYYKHLKEKLKEQQSKIDLARAEAYEIQGEIECFQQEKLQSLVGRFFKTKDNDVFVVTGVPKPTYTMIDKHFNPYQIPVLIATFAGPKEKILGKEIYIERETVFSRAVDADDPEEKFLKEYVEITKAEFLAAIVNNLEDIVDSIGE